MNPIAIANFWRKVKAVGKCWEWQGGKTVDGYGQARWGPATLLAHRIAFALVNGWNPQDLDPALQILHRCDNPPCCLPYHLFTGDPALNAEDKRLKGRAKTGRTSRYHGVVRVGARWRAVIRYKGENVHIGYYGSEQDAALAVDAQRLALGDLGAALNLPVASIVPAATLPPPPEPPK